MTQRCARLFSLGELLLEVEARRARGEKVVFTNGCFDIIHPGHVHCLVRARAEGDFLIVGLNCDDRVRELKGPGRPIHSESERAAVLLALECVDAVIVFEEETPLYLVKAILPHVLVKGGDYTPDEIVGKKAVEKAGGRVVIVPLLEGHSTSRLCQFMRQ